MLTLILPHFWIIVHEKRGRSFHVPLFIDLYEMIFDRHQTYNVVHYS